jgi:hypothetical protein
MTYLFRLDSAYTDTRFKEQVKYLNGNPDGLYPTEEDKIRRMKADAEIYWKFVKSDDAVSRLDQLIDLLLSTPSLLDSLVAVERCISREEKDSEYMYYYRGILEPHSDRYAEEADPMETNVCLLQCPLLAQIGVGNPMHTSQTSIVLDGVLLCNFICIFLSLTLY